MNHVRRISGFPPPHTHTQCRDLRVSNMEFIIYRSWFEIFSPNHLLVLGYFAQCTTNMLVFYHLLFSPVEMEILQSFIQTLKTQLQKLSNFMTFEIFDHRCKIQVGCGVFIYPAVIFFSTLMNIHVEHSHKILNPMFGFF